MNLGHRDYATASQATTEPSAERHWPAGAIPVVDSAALLNGARELLIRHGGECYRLRHTRNDKLILTK